MIRSSCDNRPRMSTPTLSFARRDDHRVFLGVAGGFADQHGVDAVVVRAALVMLSFAGGLGVVLYVLGHLLASSGTTDLARPQPLDQRRNLAVAALSLGAALLVRGAGLWLGDVFMVTVIVVASGVALLGVLRPDSNMLGLNGQGSPLAEVLAGRHARARIIAGAALVATGLVLVGNTGGVSTNLQIGVYATALTIVGVAVLVGPWLARLAQEAAAERRERTRMDEREAMAAHLHDSVLQTLALIQRNADDPRRTVTLARRQEAELREWLYGRGATDTAATLSGALRQMVAEVEDLHDIRVEPVVVGDQPTNDGSNALIAAIREALVNAAKHSGVDKVAVFVEVGPTRVDAYVRDRGIGFDRATVSADGRGGIARSMEGRLERVGGSVDITTTPGGGTEVHLSLPLGDVSQGARR